jgi:hypothetical protein
MRPNLSDTRRIIASVLCAAFVLQFCPSQAGAVDGPRIIIEIGQPSVWSLGQAHYLLSKMHRRDRKLSTKFPGEDDLDSNRISATRIEALRSSLSVEGQFDQAMGVKNSLGSKRFSEGEARRATARRDLLARQAELQQVNLELADLNEQIAVTQEEDRQSTEARARVTPPAPPTTEDNERKKQLVLMGVKKTRREEQRTELKTQITALQTTADTPTAAPTFEEPTTSSTNALPNPATLQKFMDKALAEAGKPDLSASMKLDNFVGMQYEIIAKQLTLLRDEVGPDDRVIFFELPASIYTVDKKADDYVAKIQWQINKYYDTEPPADVQAEVIENTLRNEGKSDEEILTTLLQIDKVRDDSRTETLRTLVIQRRRAQLTRASEKFSEKQRDSYVSRSMGYFVRELDRIHDKPPTPYPVTLEMIKLAAQRDPNYKGKDAAEVVSGTTKKLNVRTIDIIPRQSALNVNEYHAMVKQTMILAAFKFLVGFAGKVDYQRQRELYEQFVQQQIFASGYGKGSDKFGWIYGPQPGTKRIAPGQKTTFAVLVVPRNTLGVELKATSAFYKRTTSPEPDNDNKVKSSGEASFLLSIPGKRTQEFWVDGVSYAPVKKGKRVTAIIEGNYFSPQLGIMINGVPLEPVLSIARIAGADEETDVQSADSVVGEYEVTNSRQIVISFTMGENYVGTPTITFTSPEKSTPINFFELDINHRENLEPLQLHSVREPMFIEDFNLDKELEELQSFDRVKLDVAGNNELDKDGNPISLKFRLVRLKGSGLRPKADITVNDVSIGEPLPTMPVSKALERIKDEPYKEFTMQESTQSYLLYFQDAGGLERKIRYRQLTRQGYEEKEFTEDFRQPAIKSSIRNYRFDYGVHSGEVDLTFVATAEGATIDSIVLDDPQNGRCLPLRQDGKKFRVKCIVPAANGGRVERDFMSVRVVVKSGNTSVVKYEDIHLPVRPLIVSVINPRTGRATGFADEQPVVVISGANLQGVTGVLFGNEKAEVTGTTSDSMTVKVPKGPGVPKGEGFAVPVVLQTVEGQAPSGLIYTYQGEPLPPNVVVWPYGPRRLH